MNHDLASFYMQYETIINSNMSSQEKDKALSNLMTEMEKAYHIPLLRDSEWETKNKKVIALYRILSQSRESI